MVELLGPKTLIEQNMLCATWIDNIQVPQFDGMPRCMFFMNETLLLDENIRGFFDVKNVKSFYEHGQEFVCLKGMEDQRGKVNKNINVPNQ